MFSETFKDNSNLITGILLTIIPLLREILKSGKKSILYMLFIIACGIGLIWFGIDKNRSNSDKDEIATKKEDSLNRTIVTLNTSFNSLKDTFSNYRKDNNIFLERLKNDFKITKDSTTNKPVSIKYQTNIGNAKDVNIGDR